MAGRSTIRLIAVVLVLALAVSAVAGLLAWRSTSRRLDHLEAAYKATTAAANATYRTDVAQNGALRVVQQRLLTVETAAPITTTTTTTAAVDLTSRVAALERIVGKPPITGNVFPTQLESEVLTLCNWAVANGLRDYVCGFAP